MNWQRFFSFFNVDVFVNNKRTMIAGKIIFFRKYRYLNSLLNATHPIKIHRAVLNKLQFEKKNLKEISKRLSQFYSHNRWTYKTHFIHFPIFFSKNNQPNGLKFSQIIAIYILHYRDFSPKN